MRFILNFILFGIIFYAIWFFFPEAFMKMVSWAGAVFGYIRDVVDSFIQKVSQNRPHPQTQTAEIINFIYTQLK